jgi:alpha-2-macroglobulin
MTRTIQKTLPFFFLSIFLLFSNSCWKSQGIPVFNPEYMQFVSAYTYGVIDKKSSIQVVLLKPISDTVGLYKKTQGLFRFDPKIKGTAKYVDAQTFVFEPEEALPLGNVYHARFELGDIMEVKKELETFHFQFETERQHLTYSYSSLNSYPDPTYQSLQGTVRLGDGVEIEDLENLLIARLGSKEMKTKWTHNYGTRYQFRIDSIKREAKSQSLVCIFDGQVIGASEIYNKEYEIRGLADFNLSNLNIKLEPDQEITINFSDPLDANQDLTGLITVEGVSNLKLQRTNNTVKLFFPTRIIGNRRLNISNKIKNYNGYNLVTVPSRNIHFKKPKPKIRMVGKGTIYPMNDIIYFPFETVGLKAVDVRIFKIYHNNVHQFLQVNELDRSSQLRRVGKLIKKVKVPLKNLDKSSETSWKRSTLDLSKYMANDPGAIYRVMLSFKRSYTYHTCSQSSRDYEPSENEMYWNYYSDYSRTNRYTPCQYSFYYRSARTRNIIASQIGLIAKRDRQNQYHLFASQINTSAPMPNVKMQIYDYQKNVIKEVYTDEQGMATVQMPEDETPFLLVASEGGQKSYLKLRDGNSNSLSKFQVSGVAPNKEGVKGFIYGERGVWRPGDDIYLAFILENQFSRNYPVKLEVFDPNGKLVDKQIKTKNTGGIYSLKTKTSESARTGNYMAKVTVGNAKFTKYLKIETVKPNRLKMSLNFGDSHLTSYSANSGTLTASWLHGAKARGLKARVKATVSPGNHPFKKYENYIFSDPTKVFISHSMTVFDDKLDDNGQTELKPEFGIKKGAPGFLRVAFMSEVYEKSGNFSTDNSYFTLSPYKNYVGMNLENGSLEYGTLVTGKTHPVSLQTLSAKGKKAPNRKLEVQVYKMDWSWWWERNVNVVNYISANNLRPHQQKKITSNGSGKAVFDFRVNRPEWGRFLILVKDVESGHSTGKVVYVDWPYWARSARKSPGNANMLNFTTNKKVYSKNEEVKISIPGAPQGKLLVCVENGTKVLKKFWADASEGESIITFKTTAEMHPNVYIHITGLQDYSKTANDLPVRMYGIIPIRVEDPLTHIKPKITIKDSIRPDQYQYVSVNEKDGRPMAYTLAIVDEGLLDLTAFRTPDPWNHFNKKEALGIITWDIYRHVIGSFGGQWGNVLAVGGGGGAFKMLMKKKTVKANRFKPVVKYFGPYYLKAGEKKRHKFMITNYVGAVRVMVVAANNGAYGKAAKSVKVKQPLMVISTLPRTLSPSEEIEIPVNVFALNKGLSKVSVELKVKSGLVLIGGSKKTINFNQVGDKVVTFKAKVKEESGNIMVEALVRAGNEKASHKTEMAIRLPNPVVHETQEWVLEAGKEVQGSLSQFGISGTSKSIVEISKIPSINLSKRLNYLIRYPHGCIEQTVSAAFPQLYLSKVMKLSPSRKKEINKNIEEALFKLNDFQSSDGGFSYWPGGYYVSEWGTNYAGHFMLMAEREGYTISPTLKNNWIRHQKQKANSWVSSRYYNAHLQQAYRLYTLALSGQAHLPGMNRLRQERNLNQTAAWKLAAAYALIGRTDVAVQLTKTLPQDIKKYRELNATFGSSFRDKALVLETLTLLKSTKEATVLAIELAKEMGSDRWLSTQETAFGLMSISGYLGEFSTSDRIKIDYSLNGGSVINIDTEEPIHQVSFSQNKTDFKIKNSGGSILYVRSTNSGVPLKSKGQEVNKILLMSVVNQTLTGEGINISKLEQGTQFVSEITVKNTSTHRYLEQLALTHMVPSGWEIQNSRMAAGTFTTPESRFDYKDFRDDRVNTYFSLKAGESKTFRVVLTATYLGKYILPMVQCEAMYDYSVRASKPSRQVEVVQEGELENASSD